MTVAYKHSLKENSPGWNFKQYLCKFIFTLILNTGLETLAVYI